MLLLERCFSWWNRFSAGAACLRGHFVFISCSSHVVYFSVNNYIYAFCSTEPSNTNAMLLRSARKLCRQMMDTVTAILSAEPHSAYTQRSMVDAIMSPLSLKCSLPDGDDSGSVVEWESRNSSALSSIRKQMREVEKVILVKDDMEEQFQLLTEQKTQLLEHSQRTSSLLRDAQSERSEMERLLATLKSSFEASLSSALEELESQRLASRAQIRRLENLLVKQQSQLSLLGLGYKPNLKIKERSEMPFRSKQGYSAYENRMRAYREELDSGSNCMEVNDNRTSVDYSSQLEDEILNLRVYLEAETAIRAAGENELRVLQDKLSKLEKKSPEPDNRSAVQLIKDTEARGIEDQNEIFMTADFKDNLIAELNTLRRQQKDELIQMGYKLNALEGTACENLFPMSLKIFCFLFVATALNTSSEENQRQRETVMLLRTQLVSSKEEVARKDDAISAYKKKKVALGKEVENLQRSLSQAESKLSKYAKPLRPMPPPFDDYFMVVYGRLSSVEVSKSIAMKELKRKYEEAVVSATDKELFSPTAAELLRRFTVILPSL